MIHAELLCSGPTVVWQFRRIPSGRWGDAYDFVVTGVAEEPYSTITLKGALGRFDADVWDELFVALDARGFTHFRQLKRGKYRVFEIKPHKEASYG